MPASRPLALFAFATSWLGACASAPATSTAVAPTAAPGTPAAAPGAPAQPAAATLSVALTPAVCEGAGRRRDFDFWVGNWEVRGPKGKIVGENRIEPIHGGCALLESWQSASGVAGSSFNFYDPARKKWRQVWVDRQGGIIDLEGGLVGAAMVLEGTSLQPDGSLGKIRGTWTPMPGGNVRQVFEESPDGAAWKITFDGTYSRKP